MSIEFRVLGQPTKDNAVYLEVDSGQAITRLLFDCGHGCLDEISVSNLQSLDAAFISHFHMDHVSDFDSLLRFNFSREAANPFLVIGPQDACRAIHHKLQGFTWNLVADSLGVIEVREYVAKTQHRQLFHTRNQFVTPDESHSASWDDRVVFQNQDCTVSMIELDHGCVSGGYLVRESSRSNVDTTKLRELGLSPGPWLKHLKQLKDSHHSQSDFDASDFDETIEIDGKSISVSSLREQLLVESKGQSFAYLTDFRATGERWHELVEFIREVDVLVCENSYTSADKELATKNFHMTTGDVAALAREANVGELILFHLSSRYEQDVFPEQLLEAQKVFPNTRWPDGWFT